MTLERKGWTWLDAHQPLYPNQYIILAGNPASGKTLMVSLAKLILNDLATTPNGIFLGPDNPTKASFLKEFEKATKLPINGVRVPIYSAMAVLCMEFGVLISRFEKDFVADLTTVYDNPPLYTSPRKSVEGAKIDGPTLNILAAATPDALADTIPEIAWSQGFTSRYIFVYGNSPKTYRDMFARPKKYDLTNLQTKLKEYFYDLQGEFIWDDDAKDADRHWFNEEDQFPVPKYGRLLHYVGRRHEHLAKLAMVSAVSAGHGLNITLSDFRRAQKWLFAAEKTMPDVFRAMHQKSDKQILTDAHQWLYDKWFAVKVEDRKPIAERELWLWFEDKVPSDKIAGYVISMERTGRMRKGIPGEWIPNTFDKFYDP
jgi:hypothetical protein